LPILYLRGVSTGDFQEALAALLGNGAPNLSSAVISRLTAAWQADCDWRKRDLSPPVRRLRANGPWRPSPGVRRLNTWNTRHHGARSAGTFE
jgi:hypothetical protein